MVSVVVGESQDSVPLHDKDSVNVREIEPAELDFNFQPEGSPDVVSRSCVLAHALPGDGAVVDRVTASVPMTLDSEGSTDSLEA